MKAQSGLTQTGPWPCAGSSSPLRVSKTHSCRCAVAQAHARAGRADRLAQQLLAAVDTQAVGVGIDRRPVSRPGGPSAASLRSICGARSAASASVVASPTADGLVRKPPARRTRQARQAEGDAALATVAPASAAAAARSQPGTPGAPAAGRRRGSERAATSCRSEGRSRPDSNPAQKVPTMVTGVPTRPGEDAVHVAVGERDAAVGQCVPGALAVDLDQAADAGAQRHLAVRRPKEKRARSSRSGSRSAAAVLADGARR